MDKYQANKRTETVMRAGWGVAATIAAASVVLAPAGLAVAEPTQNGNAYQTIGVLEDEGYNVIIDRVGNAPINQCVVTSVRNPQTQTRTFWVGGQGSSACHRRRQQVDKRDVELRRLNRDLLPGVVFGCRPSRIHVAPSSGIKLRYCEFH